MKILGAICIITSCGFYGLGFYKQCISRINFTQGLIDGFEYIKNDILFTMEVLSDVLYKASTFSGESSAFFEKISLELQHEGTTLSDAYENSKFILKANTNKQVFAITRDTILQLGKSDVEGQDNLLHSAIEKLRISLEQQKNFSEKEGIMCRKIGVVAGIALSILLF